MRTRYLALAGAFQAAALAAAGAAATAEPTKEQAEFFESKIRPILAESCYKCHSLEQGKSKGGLTMDTREGLLKGGENGAIVKPGDPEKSPMIVAVKYQDKELQMPPKGDKLKPEQITALVEWVKMGAPDPRKTSEKLAKLSGLTDKARLHWSYLPVKKPAVPVNKNQQWCVTPVDAFILQKLEEKKMMPPMDAGVTPKGANEQLKRGILLRRASYDLIGLPPTTDELKAFLLNPAPFPAAFSKEIERLLASKHYGERWGRFWLDSARYADTIGGTANTQTTDYRYPYAWTYRDYVLNAFNSDKPYDQFIIEQLAADKMPGIEKDKSRLAGLGFLTVGMRFGNANDEINDRIDVVSKGFLAMTVACARCHDHMFDPIPTKDYYALHGIFASITEPKEAELISNPTPKLLKDFETKMGMLEDENRKGFYKNAEENNDLFRQNAGAYLMAAHFGKNVNDTAMLQKRDEIIQSFKLKAPLVNYLRNRVRNDELVFGPWKHFEDLSDAEFAKAYPKVCDEIAQNKGGKYNVTLATAFTDLQLKSLQDVADVYTKVFSGTQAKAKAFLDALAAAKSEASEITAVDKASQQLLGEPIKVEPAYALNSDHVRELFNALPNQLRNGNRFKFAAINELKLTHPGSPMRAMTVKDKPNPQDSPVFIRGQAGVPGDTVPRRFLEILSGPKPKPFKEGSGRLELAKAIASKSNPLTARVMVNRVWMHHFGEGFVRTPDDLGNMSEAPSHPELLDYLSSYFMERNWSIKDLHRLIMNSKIYQASSDATKQEYVDMDPENRLLWRANIRRLDFEAMRDSLLVFAGKLDPQVGGQPVNLTDEPYSFRRSVYGYIDRGNLPELMQHFDFSNPDMPNSKRTTTIVPQQALFMMNSPMSIDVSRSIVARIAGIHDPLGRVLAMYNILFQRQARPEEIALAYQFINQDDKTHLQITDEQKKLNEKLAKKAADAAGDTMMNDRNNGMKAIQNEGSYIERKPLTSWETYAQSLLLSNEASYVN